MPARSSRCSCVRLLAGLRGSGLGALSGGCRGCGLLGLLLRLLLGLAALALLFFAAAPLVLLGLALCLGVAPRVRGLVNRLANGADDKLARADRVVVAGNRIGDRQRVD